MVVGFLRTWPTAAAVVLLVTAGCGTPGDEAAAGCAGPDVRLSPATAAPGDDVRVRARFLWSECYDTGQPGTPPPRQDVRVTFTAEGRTVLLATVDAEPGGTLDTTVQVPDDALPGPAEIAVDHASTTLMVEAPA